ncbi:MAG TPA: hypothetical protein ENK77_04675, partial [Epsilonproteobacteria bacterium]|nr:hypothetical protein [Campylobacterota bacterium]
KPMGNMHFDAETRLSRGSLLPELEENVKWENMFPLHLETSLWQKQLRVNFYNRYIRFQSFYDTDVQNLTAFINHPTLKFTASGNTQEKVWLQAKVTSMERLAESITSLYTMKKPPKVSGDIQIDAVITEMQHASLEVQTPMVSYQVNHQTNKSLQDVSLKMELEDTNMTLNSYHVTHEGITVFATKPSYLRLLESNLTVLPFWVNDAVEVRGYYDLAAKKGQIDTRSERVRVAHTMAEVSAALDITARMEGNATDVSGKVTILEGDILYDLNQKRFASDSDIVIVQDIEETESSPLMENLSINVLVESQKPLVYDKGAMDVKVRPGVGVHKAKYSDLMVLGTVELPKGGSYMFEGKKFVLDQSYIYFTGDMNKPLLDITVKYKALNHEITVTVAGTPAAPNIRFSSVPSLSKEEILSVILFDSEVGAGSHTGDEMMRMMGGAVAKSALSNVGVQLDHLVIGDNNSLEVGKKLTDDITVIYINGEIPKIELMYQHKEHLQSVLGASEESSSYDLIYKKDF